MTNSLRENILAFLKESGTKPLTVEEIEVKLGIDDPKESKQLVITLNELEESGFLIRTRKDRFGLPEKMNLVRGKVEMNKKGFAFIIPDNPEATDVYVHSSDMSSAMNNDIVIVRLEKKGGRDNRPEGVIIRVIERANHQIVGTFEDNRSFGFVVPDDKRIPNDIFISKNNSNGAASGHKVIVNILKYPEGRNSAEGAVAEILGHKNDPGIDILSIIYKHGLNIDFPEAVLDAAGKVSDTVTEADLDNRRDLRDEVIVTIDGADAKDLDDAIRVEKLSNGNYLLGVYIADVSHYITENSIMDKEAYHRGTSVYLVDRVLPMIPHRLSNGICSLNRGEDRLTLSCEMEINAAGEIVNHDIFQSVINTTERMTYEDVNEILVNKDPELTKKFEKLVPGFVLMEQLAEVLRNKRMKRGAIDFDFKEAQVIVDDAGKAVDVVLRERSVGEKLIEEFMLCANETVAEHIHWLEVPFIHRVHESPDEAKLEHFFEFIAGLGYGVKGVASDVHPLELQGILAKVKGEKEEMVISKLMLRSMKKAKYDPESIGHYGLSTDFYTHFTSPIRRYPDLIVHRLIRTYLLNGDMSSKTLNHWKNALGEIAKHTSAMERTAIEAERDVDDLKKAEYMSDKVGEEFDAIVSSVTSFGLFVELENTVEGLVHISYMTDDYYNFNERSQALIGERTGTVFRVGEEVKVRVINVNMEEHAVDFELI